MLPAPLPDNEAERLASLRRMQLLSSPDEEAFDRITRIARRLFEVPIALVSLIDAHRQWFKSCVGLPVRETPRDVSFCGHAILQDDLLVIEDSRQDPRFADNPLVTGAPHVIFYAGRPLRNPDGFAVGTLCLIDAQPRHFSQEARELLHDLGGCVEQIFLGRELSETQRQLLDELDDARRASMLDPMLNIWHRGAIIGMLEREVQRAFRNRSSLALMAIDVDDFNLIVDGHGRNAADALLIELVRRLRTVTRSYDSFGRLGEDRFLVILPETTGAMAAEVAARLQKAIDFPFLIGEQVLEVSAGIGGALADFVAETPDSLELVEQLELALVTAKRQGAGGLWIGDAAA